jgi:hypothetical protein
MPASLDRLINILPASNEPIDREPRAHPRQVARGCRGIAACCRTGSSVPGDGKMRLYMTRIA